MRRTLRKPTCADLAADCMITDGVKRCGCALAWNHPFNDVSGTPPTRLSATMRSLLAAVPAEGREQAQCEMEPNCCHWVDSGAVGGTQGGCTCRAAWALQDESCADGDKIYNGCNMAVPCDGQSGGVPGMSWCMVEDASACAAAGNNWDFCIPNAPSCVTLPGSLLTLESMGVDKHTGGATRGRAPGGAAAWLAGALGLLALSAG